MDPNQELEGCLRMAEILARRFCAARGPYWQALEGDFIQEAQLAVCRTFRSFDPARGRLSTLVYPVIGKHLSRYAGTVRGKVPTISLETAVGADGETPLSEFVADDRVDVEGAALNSADAGELGKHLAALKGRHRLVIERRYLSGWTFDRIAAELGITKQGANALHRVALKKLRGRLTIQQHQGPAGR